LTDLVVDDHFTSGDGVLVNAEVGLDFVESQIVGGLLLYRSNGGFEYLWAKSTQLSLMQ